MPQDAWKILPFGLGLFSIGLVLFAIVGCPSSDADAPPAHSGGEKTKPAAGTKPNSTKPKTDDAHKLSSAPAVTKKAVPSAGPKPMLNGWTKPALAIVISGQQHGYMEPCGCSITQSGGLSRRADFFRQLDEKGWAYTALDLGGLVRKDNLQNKFKFQVMLSALKDLGYKAMAIGKEEISLERLDPGFLLVRATEAAASGEAPTFLSANVEFTLFKDANGGPAAATKLVKVGGHKLGVTAVFGEDLKAELFGNAPDPQISIKPPQAVLPTAIAALKQEQPEVLVLLVHANRNESQALAKKFPEFDLVVTSGPEDGTDAPLHFGKTLYLEVGQKGKHIGIVGYYPDNKQQPFRFELVDLDKERFHDTPKMLDRMREYQHLLESNYDAVLQDLPKPPHPSGDRYAGVETCKDCHKNAYAVWKGSKHANAYQSLITGREGMKNPIPRNHDPECLSCHTTGWDPQRMFPFESGFVSVEKTPALKDQQCENCHGPSATHVDRELRWKKDANSVKKQDLEAARAKIRLKTAAAKTMCYRCHDLDNDPNFKFDKYWPEVEHPGKD